MRIKLWHSIWDKTDYDEVVPHKSQKEMEEYLNVKFNEGHKTLFKGCGPIEIETTDYECMEDGA